MLSNYIKIALRNILRNKLHSFINIMGLSIGMACTILLFLFVRDELSYDKYHSKHDRIYMVQSSYRSGDRDGYSIGSTIAIGPALKDEYPVIEESVRTFDATGLFIVDPKGEVIRENNIYYADPGIFRVFDHNFIYGTPDGALDSPHTIVLNETLAKKYFGDQNPVGKILSRSDGVDYTVKGVFKDLPRNSFLHYTALIPMMDLTEKFGFEYQKQRAPEAFFGVLSLINTYILLTENADIESVKTDYERFRDKYYAEYAKQTNMDFKPVFEPLTGVYLHLRMSEDSPPPILIRIYILSSLAMFILIIACINYMNLTTAKSTTRAREVGVRKSLGADRASLIRQFLSESMVITMVALVISLVLIELFLPAFNDLTEKEIAFSVFKQPLVLTGLVIIALVVGFISGSYPAFLLSSFLPAKVIKGDIQSDAGKGILRKILVIVQFSISIIVIINTMILQDQMDYIQRKDLGYNKENIMMMVPTGLQITQGDKNDADSILTFMREIRKNSGIISVTRSSHSTAGTGVWNTLGRVEKSSGEFEKKQLGYVLVDFDFIDLMQMEVLEGRSFNREMGTDKTDAVLVNETLVNEMGWKDSAIGKRIQLQIGRGSRDCKVIGVLKDFHFQSLHAKLMPQIILLDVDAANIFIPVISIKIRPENLKETIGFIKEKWLELNPTLAFEYTFLEDRVHNQYRNEERLGTIFSYFVFLCIFISCLGLFGLSSFIVEKRTKEIGIRKVHGASVWNIIYRLSRDFIKLVLISSIIAWPIAYYAMRELLFNFYPYRASMDPLIFIIPACVAMAVALITISYHVTKAAMQDPVKALRYE